METKRQLLSLAESKALRGIAILGIILHNYCHFLGFAVKENEYTFTLDKPMQLLDRLCSLNKDLFIHIFSFFGHYGVPLFLFISGFGLVAKYEQKERGRNFGALPFIGYHYAKLLRLMFLGYIAFAVVCYLHPHGYHGYTFGRVAAQLLMYINLMPGPEHIIKPGPYWYFGLTLQLYIVYRLLLYRRSSALVVLLIALCWAIQTIWSPELFGSRDTLNYIRYNFIGAMLPFGMGMLYARHGRQLAKPTYAAIVVVSAVAVFAGSYNFHSWLWVPAFVVCGAIATVKLIPAKALAPAVWFGTISSALFVVHPILREIIIPMSYRGNVYTGIILYFVSAVICACLFRMILRFIPSPKLNAKAG